MSERRLVGRTRILRNAEIVVGGRVVSKVQCTLQDLTNTGACLTLASTYRVPDKFELTFDQDRSRRSCWVKWRTSDRLGVSFSKPE
jgi:methyl-accepting chemotaxis protein